jgi:hypothetical protein
MSQAIRTIAGHLEIDAEICVNRMELFQIQAGHCQSLREHIDGDIERDILSEPVPTDEHFVSPFPLNRPLTIFPDDPPSLRQISFSSLDRAPDFHRRGFHRDADEAGERPILAKGAACSQTRSTWSPFVAAGEIAVEGPLM